MVLLGVYSLLCMRIKSMVLYGVSAITDVTNDPSSEWRRRRVDIHDTQYLMLNVLHNVGF